jgi:hypothetical protein
MPRSLSLAALAFLVTAFPAGRQSADPSAPPALKPQDAVPGAEVKKPKRVLTNEDLSKSRGKISVVGDAEAPPKPVAAPRTASPQYIAAVRKQLEKLQKQISDLDKQITDLKNFNSGEPSTGASGIQLDKRYEREPIEVQIRALKDKKKDLAAKVDALYDEARKRGVESGELP